MVHTSSLNVCCYLRVRDLTNIHYYSQHFSRRITPIKFKRHLRVSALLDNASAPLRDSSAIHAIQLRKVNFTERIQEGQRQR